MKAVATHLHLIVFFMSYTNVLAAKITVIQWPGGQYIISKAIGEELARRGHEVTICIPSNRPEGKNDTTAFGQSAYGVLHFYQGFEQEVYDSLMSDTSSKKSKSIFFPLQYLNALSRFGNDLCSQIINNSKVIKSIQNADLLLSQIDIPCSGAVAKVFEKRWIGIGHSVYTYLISKGQEVYLNPSYQPFFLTALTDNMNVFQRVQSYLVDKAIIPMLRWWIPKYFTPFLAKTGKDEIDVRYNLTNAEMIIGNCDFAINYPYPQMPNNMCVGPITAKSAAKLPLEFESLVNSSTNGIIIVAFGSVLGFLQKWQVEAMAGAFGRLKQTVLWQLKDTSYNIRLPRNIKVVKWLPQNDLLGHPKTKLFISHAGQSSLMEACYHGVPVLAVPHVLDQFQNSILISDRVKMGIQLDFSEANEDDWFEAIKEILSNESYAINAKRVSRRIRSKNKSPRELAGDLIENVISNNYDMSHLRSRGPDLPWHVVNLYDVYAFLLFAIAVLLLSVYFASKKCLQLLYVRKQKGE